MTRRNLQKFQKLEATEFLNFNQNKFCLERKYWVDIAHDWNLQMLGGWWQWWVIQKITNLTLGLLKFSFWKWKQGTCSFLKLFNIKVFEFWEAWKKIFQHFPETTHLENFLQIQFLKMCSPTFFLCCFFPFPF